MNLLRKLTLVLLAASGFGLALASDGHLSISTARIAQAKAAIQKKFLINSVLRSSIMAGGAVAGGIILYHMWKNWYVHEATGSLQHAEFGSSIWCGKMFQITRDALISTALTRGALVYGEQALHEIFHERSISWFISAQTNIVDTLKEIHEFSKILDDAKSYSQEQHTYAHASLALTLKSLLVQIEQIIAFIEYQSQYFEIKDDAKLAHAIALIPEYMKDCTEQFLSAWAKRESDPSYILTPRVEIYAKEITDAINRFAHLEKDVAWINSLSA